MPIPITSQIMAKLKGGNSFSATAAARVEAHHQHPDVAIAPI
jgi:hypothetical protein